MTTVACVLRSGGDFGPDWVQRLARGVARHLPSVHRFVCLSDVEVPGVTCVPLVHDWPRWWPKVELFRPGLFAGPVLYLDLDTLPVGDLSDIAGYTGPLALLSDFYAPQLAASGVMLWRPSPVTAAVHTAFLADPAGIMRRHRARMDLWLREQLPGAERVQELWPGQVCSLKAHARAAAPAGTRLVAGHGQPRFSDPAAGWAHTAWSAA